MPDSPPALALELVWAGEERFRGRSGGVELDIDGNSQAGPSPVQALAFALAVCMAIDVADILTKGRQQLRALRARLAAQRGPEPPKRLTAVELHFEVKGEVAPDRVEHAIALSREKYCSVWHSLRQDIDFRTSFEILA